MVLNGGKKISSSWSRATKR